MEICWCSSALSMLDVIMTYRWTSLVPKPLPVSIFSSCEIKIWEWPGDGATVNKESGSELLRCHVSVLKSWRRRRGGDVAEKSHGCFCLAKGELISHWVQHHDAYVQHVPMGRIRGILVEFIKKPLLACRSGLSTITATGLDWWTDTKKSFFF